MFISRDIHLIKYPKKGGNPAKERRSNEIEALQVSLKLSLI
jgi:hypothetical protein